MGSPVVFIILAIISIGSAIGMLTSRNAIYSALFLVLNFVTAAVFYIVLSAPFIAMVQITVYAGAIMVLFLFVIMLLGADRLGGDDNLGGGWQRPLALILSVGLGVALILALMGQGGGSAGTASGDEFIASPEAIGLHLFENYVFPFEVTSILLLVAMMSLVVWRTSKKKKAIVKSENPQ